ncbi:hypothetical protein OPV22_014823 [Ensete ventricosum]|uniref:Uncharacterized protein n=1 Tax=Ensete ventricosum TaxID=4639 RepID=A0AAV8QYM7_ENSVE|nr:hypothetical protein OPV22_014823 [Ensete ventricosum]
MFCRRKGFILFGSTGESEEKKKGRILINLELTRFLRNIHIEVIIAGPFSPLWFMKHDINGTASVLSKGRLELQPRLR